MQGKDAVTREQIEAWAKLAGIDHFTEKGLERLGDFAIFARAALHPAAPEKTDGEAAFMCHETGVGTANSANAAIALSHPTSQSTHWTPETVALVREDAERLLARLTPGRLVDDASEPKAPTVEQMVNRAREHGMDLGDNPVAYEFYNKETGHAIVDYTRWTHAGHLTDTAGYEARPLVYASQPKGLTDEQIERIWK